MGAPACENSRVFVECGPNLDQIRGNFGQVEFFVTAELHEEMKFIVGMVKGGAMNPVDRGANFAC